MIYPDLFYSSEVEVEYAVEDLDEMLLVHVGEDGDGHWLQVGRDLVLIQPIDLYTPDRK